MAAATSKNEYFGYKGRIVKSHSKENKYTFRRLNPVVEEPITEEPNPNIVSPKLSRLQKIRAHREVKDVKKKINFPEKKRIPLKPTTHSNCNPPPLQNFIAKNKMVPKSTFVPKGIPQSVVLPKKPQRQDMQSNKEKKNSASKLSSRGSQKSEESWSLNFCADISSIEPTSKNISFAPEDFIFSAIENVAEFDFLSSVDKSNIPENIQRSSTPIQENKNSLVNSKEKSKIVKSQLKPISLANNKVPQNTFKSKLESTGIQAPFVRKSLKYAHIKPKVQSLIKEQKCGAKLKPSQKLQSLPNKNNLAHSTPTVNKLKTELSHSTPSSLRKIPVSKKSTVSPIVTTKTIVKSNLKNRLQIMNKNDLNVEKLNVVNKSQTPNKDHLKSDENQACQPSSATSTENLNSCEETIDNKFQDVLNKCLENHSILDEHVLPNHNTLSTAHVVEENARRPIFSQSYSEVSLIENEKLPDISIDLDDLDNSTYYSCFHNSSLNNKTPFRKHRTSEESICSQFNKLGIASEIESNNSAFESLTSRNRLSLLPEDFVESKEFELIACNTPCVNIFKRKDNLKQANGTSYPVENVPVIAVEEVNLDKKIISVESSLTKNDFVINGAAELCAEDVSVIKIENVSTDASHEQYISATDASHEQYVSATDASHEQYISATDTTECQNEKFSKICLDTVHFKSNETISDEGLNVGLKNSIPVDSCVGNRKDESRQMFANTVTTDFLESQVNVEEVPPPVSIICSDITNVVSTSDLVDNCDINLIAIIATSTVVNSKDRVDSVDTIKIADNSSEIECSASILIPKTMDSDGGRVKLLDEVPASNAINSTESEKFSVDVSTAMRIENNKTNIADLSRSEIESNFVYNKENVSNKMLVSKAVTFSDSEVNAINDVSAIDMIDFSEDVCTVNPILDRNTDSYSMGEVPITNGVNLESFNHYLPNVVPSANVVDFDKISSINEESTKNQISYNDAVNELQTSVCLEDSKNASQIGETVLHLSGVECTTNLGLVNESMFRDETLHSVSLLGTPQVPKTPKGPLPENLMAFSPF